MNAILARDSILPFRTATFHLAQHRPKLWLMNAMLARQMLQAQMQTLLSQGYATGQGGQQGEQGELGDNNHTEPNPQGWS